MARRRRTRSPGDTRAHIMPEIPLLRARGTRITHGARRDRRRGRRAYLAPQSRRLAIASEAFELPSPDLRGSHTGGSGVTGGSGERGSGEGGALVGVAEEGPDARSACMRSVRREEARGAGGRSPRAGGDLLEAIAVLLMTMIVGLGWAAIELGRVDAPGPGYARWSAHDPAISISPSEATGRSSGRRQASETDRSGAAPHERRPQTTFPFRSPFRSPSQSSAWTPSQTPRSRPLPADPWTTPVSKDPIDGPTSRLPDPIMPLGTPARLTPGAVTPPDSVTPSPRPPNRTPASRPRGPAVAEPSARIERLASSRP